MSLNSILSLNFGCISVTELQIRIIKRTTTGINATCSCQKRYVEKIMVYFANS